MSLPIQDAVLLFLVLGAMCLLLIGDFASTSVSTNTTTTTKASASAERLALKPEQPPVVSKQAPPTGSPLLPRAADLLLVDDSAVARAKLRRLFEANGYTVQLAGDGVEALACLDKGSYAMMITDLEMPNMDGVALVNACLGRPDTARLPIIAVSAHENLRAKFNACRNICGVHRKPWADDILLSHVATLIGSRHVPQSVQAPSPRHSEQKAAVLA